MGERTDEGCEAIMNPLASAVVADALPGAKAFFGDKLHSLILFGSYARGDFDAESDIDIMLLLNVGRGDINRYMFDVGHLGSDLSLKHDITVSFIMVPQGEFEKYKEAMPFYRNVATEGVAYVA